MFSKFLWILFCLWNYRAYFVTVKHTISTNFSSQKQPIHGSAISRPSKNGSGPSKQKRTIQLVQPSSNAAIPHTKRQRITDIHHTQTSDGDDDSNDEEVDDDGSESESSFIAAFPEYFKNCTSKGPEPVKSPGKGVQFGGSTTKEHVALGRKRATKQTQSSKRNRHSNDDDDNSDYSQSNKTEKKEMFTNKNIFACMEVTIVNVMWKSNKGTTR